MNYKKIIKNQNVRFKILNMLSWIPDKVMVKIQYKIKTGRKLDLKAPKRYTEKLQWYKIYYRDKNMPKCVDKYEVRDYIDGLGYGRLLNKLYYVYDGSNEIDLSKLPEKFVIKDTIGGGSNSVLVVDKNSDSYDEKETVNTIKTWLSIKPQKSISREWPYDYLKHRVVVEKYLEQADGDLADYKFFCFNGKVRYFYKRSGYSKNHGNGKMSFYNRKKQWLKGVGLDYCDMSDKRQELCGNIDEMIKVADDLSADFPHVRVDLYNVDGKIVFGELTFFNAGGYMNFTPDSFDEEMGELFDIKNVKASKK